MNSIRFCWKIKKIKCLIAAYVAGEREREVTQKEVTQLSQSSFYMGKENEWELIYKDPSEQNWLSTTETTAADVKWLAAVDCWAHTQRLEDQGDQIHIYTQSKNKTSR